MAKQLLCSPDEPVVRTRAGRVRGFQYDYIYTFRGIKYADAQRFMPPEPVKPWDGVKDAINFGYNCPTQFIGFPNEDFSGWQRYCPENEHCQYLNIWTQSLDPTANKPVMVWLHGGTFIGGSGSDTFKYDGDNMARHHDAVFITLNHRINLLGYLDMSHFDARYANSVNAGIADLVAALEWVRDNIAAFGGDPGNITIFGQSGGGRKVTSLMQAPAAAGLFHKAIIQSGTTDGWNPEDSGFHRKLVCLILAEMNFPESAYDKMATVPFPVMNRAYERARVKLYEQDGVALNHGQALSPVKNGWFLGAPPHHPFTEYARKIPLIIGSNDTEVIVTPPMPDKDSYSAEKRRDIIREVYGDNTDKLIGLYKKAYPDKNEIHLIDLDRRYRYNMLKYVDRKVEESTAPVFFYMFAAEFGVEGGRGSWHGSEIAFALHNTDKSPVCHSVPAMDKLEAQMSGAWASFARTGDPNHPGLPEEWPAYDKEKRGVMVFGTESGVRWDHERDLVALHRSELERLGIIGRGGPPPQGADDEEKYVY